MAKQDAKKGSKKVAKPKKGKKTRVTGTSAKLLLEEALADAAGKLPPPKAGSDIVTAVVEKIEVTRGGFTDISTLTVTLVTK